MGVHAVQRAVATEAQDQTLPEAPRPDGHGRDEELDQTKTPRGRNGGQPDC